MTISGSDIRRDFRVVCEALAVMNERFLKADDPSMSMLDFMETVDGATQKIRAMYNREAADRSKIGPMVVKEVQGIQMACKSLLQSLKRELYGVEEPEDANKSSPG